jgi:hypothetical protein
VRLSSPSPRPKPYPAGEILYVNGTSNLPPGFSTEVALSRLKTSGYITHIPITIQGDGSFSFTVDTRTLKEGTYRLEVVEKTEFPYGSSSINWIFFDVIDRRDELTVTSPLTQDFDGTLDVTGSISTVGGQGLQLEVQQGGKTVYGPEYISTGNGAFDASVPIDTAGTYTVTLKDATEYVWTMSFSVNAPAPTTTLTPPPTTSVTTIPPAARTATTTASRTQPAYFEVDTNRGEVHITTSAGVDWVVEYLDESGNLNKVNTRGTASEEVRFTANGGTVYVKVYPDPYSDQASITLSVENAASVSVCTTCQGQFGDGIPTTTTPLPLFLALGALAVLVIVRRRS